MPDATCIVGSGQVELAIFCDTEPLQVPCCNVICILPYPLDRAHVEVSSRMSAERAERTWPSGPGQVMTDEREGIRKAECPRSL
jgi:hypothetical protein